MVINRIIININASPLSSIISPNRNNPKRRTLTLEVFFPEFIGYLPSNNRRLAFLLTVSTRPTGLVLTISYIQTFKYELEFLNFHKTSNRYPLKRNIYVAFSCLRFCDCFCFFRFCFYCAT